MALHKKDKVLLEQIKNFFWFPLRYGKIYTQGPSLIQYEVDSRKDLVAVIKHFDKYPLISSAAEKNRLIISYLSKLLI